MVRVLWNSVLGITASTSFLVVVEFEDSYPFFLSSHLRMFVFLALVSLYKFPCASLTTLSFIDILRIDQISLILRRIFPRSQRAVWHQINGSPLRQIRFRHRWTFAASRFLPSLWHCALLSDRIRKKIAEMTAIEHWHDVALTKKMVPLVTRATHFGYQQIWFGSLVVSWFCGTTNQAQLCGFWTRVSLSGFFPLWSFWWQLRCLQKCTAETRLEKNVCWWVRNPKLTITQPLFRWCVVLFLLVEWSPVLHKSRWASIPFLAVWFVERNTSITMSHKSRANNPSIRSPASNGMISDSVELWDTDACFLHIQLMETNVRLPQIHKTPPEVDIKSSKSPAKSESWNKTSRRCWAVLPTWQHCRYSFILPIVCRKPESILWLLLQVCWQTMKCLVSQFVPRTRQFVSILVRILQLIQVLPFRIDGHPSKVLKLCITAPLSCLPTHSTVQRTFSYDLPYRRTTQPSSHEVLPNLVTFSVAPAEAPDSNIFLYSSMKLSFGLHSRWVHPKFSWPRNEVGSSRSTFYIKFFHMGAIFSAFQPCWYHPHLPLRIILVFDKQKDIPNVVLFHSSSNRTYSKCLSLNIPANARPYKFRSRSSTGSSMFAQDLGHLCGGRRIHTSGHSDFGISSNLGASSNFTWV